VAGGSDGDLVVAAVAGTAADAAWETGVHVVEEGGCVGECWVLLRIVVS
jgi:hypothetical protein